MVNARYPGPSSRRRAVRVCRYRPRSVAKEPTHDIQAMALVHLMTKGERMALHSAAGDLHAQFRGVFGPETIEAMLLASYAQIAARSTVYRWLTLAAERYSRERLRVLASARIHPASAAP